MNTFSYETFFLFCQRRFFLSSAVSLILAIITVNEKGICFLVFTTSKSDKSTNWKPGPIVNKTDWIVCRIFSSRAERSWGVLLHAWSFIMCRAARVDNSCHYLIKLKWYTLSISLYFRLAHLWIPTYAPSWQSNFSSIKINENKIVSKLWFIYFTWIFRTVKSTPQIKSPSDASALQFRDKIALPWHNVFITVTTSFLPESSSYLIFKYIDGNWVTVSND